MTGSFSFNAGGFEPIKDLKRELKELKEKEIKKQVESKSLSETMDNLDSKLLSKGTGVEFSSSSAPKIEPIFQPENPAKEIDTVDKTSNTNFFNIDKVEASKPTQSPTSKESKTGSFYKSDLLEKLDSLINKDLSGQNEHLEILGARTRIKEFFCELVGDRFDDKELTSVFRDLVESKYGYFDKDKAVEMLKKLKSKISDKSGETVDIEKLMKEMTEKNLKEIDQTKLAEARKTEMEKDLKELQNAEGFNMFAFDSFFIKYGIDDAGISAIGASLGLYHTDATAYMEKLLDAVQNSDPSKLGKEDLVKLATNIRDITALESIIDLYKNPKKDAGKYSQNLYDVKLFKFMYKLEYYSESQSKMKSLLENEGTEKVLNEMLSMLKEGKTIQEVLDSILKRAPEEK